MAEYIGDGIISIKADVDQALRFFDGLGKSERSITRAIGTQVGIGGRNAVRKFYPSILNKRTGKLYKSIYYKVKKNEVIISANADSGKHTAKDGRLARYGYMLAAGYQIERKRIDKDGKEVKTKITVRPKDFVESPVDRYMMSGDLKARIDKAFDKQLEKVAKKLGVSA